jgi:multidrug transporter EmrE-like cation transporter
MSSDIAWIVASEALGDWRLAEYAKSSKPVDMAIGYGAYALALNFFIKAIRKKGLGWSNSQWDGWSNLASGAVAIFLMKEQPSRKELLGMALISSGLFLLSDGATNDTK